MMIECIFVLSTACLAIVLRFAVLQGRACQPAAGEPYQQLHGAVPRSFDAEPAPLTCASASDAKSAAWQLVSSHRCSSSAARCDSSNRRSACSSACKILNSRVPTEQYEKTCPGTCCVGEQRTSCLVKVCCHAASLACSSATASAAFACAAMSAPSTARCAAACTRCSS